jgi:membrane fusion protein, copper/silver efflux system
MSRAGWALTALAAIAAAGGGGYWVGQHGLPARDRLLAHLPALPTWASKMLPAPIQSALPPTGPVIFYRDPDGKPFYALEPKRTQDGRAYVAVHASEDVSFEDKPQVVSASEPASQAGGKRVLYYRNPMGLPDTSPVPKKDSMGMDYIPVYEGEDTDTGIVRISPGKIQRTGVRSETVERRILSVPVRAPGTIEEDERRVSVISTRTDAFVEKVENVTTGDHVHKGQPLLRLYSPEISSAAAQYLTSVGYEGARRRLENLAIPAEVIDEIERTRKVPAAITWSAPRDGVIVERNVTDGMRARSGDILFRIVDHSRVWVLADVAERDLGAVAEGQRATVRARSFPDRVFTGTVMRIYPHLTMGTRTARLRIELPNPNGDLRPAMYADVEIATGSDKPVVTVPDDAVIDTGAKQVVLLDRGDGRFEPREVTVSRRGNGYVEVRSGVTVGDRVVTSANFLIDAESNLKAALQGMAAATSGLAEEKPP